MKVIIPGTFDPVTVGHVDIIRRAAALYGEVFAVIFKNPDKTPTFPLEDRVRMLMLATEDLPNVLVSESDGRVVDYMREHGIEKIVKGYRNEKDLAYEKVQEAYNYKHGGFETEYLQTDAAYADVSSTLVRGKLARGEDVTGLLPSAVIEYIKNR